MIKGIKTAVLSGFLACSALTTVNGDENPLSFGIKAGGSSSFLMKTKDIQVDGKSGDDVKVKLLNIFAHGGIYGEYAFNDLVGMQLDAMYTREGGKLTNGESEEAKLKSVSLFTHNLNASLAAKFYLMGREPEESILSAYIGVQGSFPVFGKTITDKDGKCVDKSQEDTIKNEVFSNGNFGMVSGMDYEFPFGLTTGLRFSYNFLNAHKTDDNKSAFKDKDNLVGMEKGANWNNANIHVGIGYNLAKLISE